MKISTAAQFFAATILTFAMSAHAVGGSRVDAGQASFESKCAMCHNIEAAAGNSVGPNLHGVVGRNVGTAPGFAYSPALAKLGGRWSAERLAAFLQNPQGYAPGTAMPFAGLKNQADRLAILCFLGADPSQAPCK